MISTIFPSTSCLMLNDAKSCYNRIMFIIAALCLYRLEAIPKKQYRNWFTHWQHFYHHICTAYGNSTNHQEQQEDWDLPTAMSVKAKGLALILYSI